MKFRKVLLLFLILGFGMIVEGIHFTRTVVKDDLFEGFRDGFRSIQIDGAFPFSGLMRFRGPSFDFTTNETMDAAGVTTLEVSNAYGDVSVRRSADPKAPIKVTLRKEVFYRSRDSAEKYSNRVKLGVKRENGLMKVSTTRNLTGDPRMRTHLEIETPAPLDTRVTNRHGKITIEGATAVNATGEYDQMRIVDVKGECAAKNRHANLEVISAARGCRVEVQHGDAHVEKLSGASTVDAEHGNVTAFDLGALTANLKFSDLQARRLSGALSSTGEHSDLKIDDIKGDVTLNNQGDIDIQNVLGRVSIDNHRGHVRLLKAAAGVLIKNTSEEVTASDVAGRLEVTNQHGSIRVQRFLKGAALESDSEDIEASDFSGPLTIMVKRGDVSVKPMRKTLGPMDISVDIGDVNVAMPDLGAASIDVSVERGDVEGNLSGLKTTEQSKRALKGSIGNGGPLLKLRSRLGNIKVSGSDAFEVRAPDLPEAPDIERRAGIPEGAPVLAGPVMPPMPGKPPMAGIPAPPKSLKPMPPTSAPPARPAPPAPTATPEGLNR